jgi:hypothetical protein
VAAGREWREIDIDPQLTLGEIMSRGAAILTQIVRIHLAQLLDGGLGAGIQGACNRGLFGEVGTLPRLRQDSIGPEPCVDLLNRGAARPDADETVK